MFGFVLYGLGIGIGYYPILKTSWKYFPNSKGFLTGLILSVFGLCPMVFTSIADAVMNPKGEPMQDEIFPPEIAEKMKNFALIMAVTMGVCGVLSQILMFPIDNVISNVSENEDNNSNNNKSKQSFTSNEICDSETNKNSEEKDLIEHSKEDPDVKEPFMQACKSCRFHLFNFMSVGTLCKIYSLFNNYLYINNSLWIFFNKYI